MERSEFMPGDNDWLDELLGDFGNDKQSEQQSLSHQEILEPATQKEWQQMGVLIPYFQSTYPDRYMTRPEDITKEALRLMRTLAAFCEEAGIKTEDGTIKRVGEMYPDMSVRFTYFSLSHFWQSANDMKEKSLLGTDRKKMSEAMENYFGVLKDIALEAVRLEDLRKMREQEKW